MELLSLRDLCAHLRVDDERTALKIAAAHGLMPRARFGKKEHYWFVADNLFRFIHRIEPFAHRQILDDLMRPLLHFADVAALLGKTSEGLRKDITRGKLALPPPIQLTDRTRAWRARDIECWVRGEPLPAYTPYLAAAATAPEQECAPATEAEHQGAASTAPAVIQKANPDSSFDLLADLFLPPEEIKLAIPTSNRHPISTAA